MSWIHPETRNGETFFRNMPEAQFELLNFSSKRKGLVAYDGDGRSLGLPDWFPVFVRVRDLEGRNAERSVIRRTSWIEGYTVESKHKVTSNK